MADSENEQDEQKATSGSSNPNGNVRIAAIAIELDDASHNTEKAKRKDWFKDQLFRCDPVLLVRIDEIPDEAKMDVLVDRCAEVANERREHYAKLFDKWKSFF